MWRGDKKTALHAGAAPVLPHSSQGAAWRSKPQISADTVRPFQNSNTTHLVCIGDPPHFPLVAFAPSAPQFSIGKQASAFSPCSRPWPRSFPSPSPPPPPCGPSPSSLPPTDQTPARSAPPCPCPHPLAAPAESPRSLPEAPQSRSAQPGFDSGARGCGQVKRLGGRPWKWTTPCACRHASRPLGCP